MVKKKKNNYKSRETTTSTSDKKRANPPSPSARPTPPPKKSKRYSLSTASSQSLAQPSSKAKTNDLVENLLPLPFPHSPTRPIPTNSFLRPIEPYEESFQTALETSYLGFEIDDARREKKLFDHDAIEKALLTMDKCGLFRTDVTQPFGLGTKCAKTYVTRCLLGVEGTTYKYLGLRMFSHPWRGENNQIDSKAPPSRSPLDKALNTIAKLNESLTERTVLHLDNLDRKRKKCMSSKPIAFTKGQRMVKGRAKFDVALINRMVETNNLKKEPSMGDGRCSVSWHADSSLEHYSSIAVYHTILNNSVVQDDIYSKNVDRKANTEYTKNASSSDRWSIALRVAHHSEGPRSSRRGTDTESAVVSDTPPLAVSLPSQSAYYLLSDFNHHHQHAVLVNDNNEMNSHSAGIRFASTHRLLKEGHNVYFMINRCHSVCSQFHKKGPKIWRSEQLLLNEIESEWIRQFFIQGEGHKSNLWKYWREPICQLLMYWSRLEQRTKQVLDLLRYAAQERCRVNEEEQKEPPLKRKERDKQKKALAAIEDLLSRNKKDNSMQNGKANNSSALISIYLPMSKLISERSRMRMLWCQRENDKLFKSMHWEYRPIVVPFQFNVAAENIVATKKGDRTKEVGTSPLSGSHETLERVSEAVKQLGVVFMSQKYSDLPNMNIFDFSKGTASIKQTTGDKIKEYNEDAGAKNVIEGSAVSTKIVHDKSDDTVQQKKQQETRQPKPEKVVATLDPSEHTKNLEWSGWKKHSFGLEIQKPWASLLLEGSKTIETRLYDLPKSLVGKRIVILESQPGQARVSSLGNILIGDDIHEKVKILGWVVFSRVIIYRYFSKFEADEKKHLVTKESSYGWKKDTKVVYGWVVSKKGKYSKSAKTPSIHSLVRRMRSLYSIVLKE